MTWTNSDFMGWLLDESKVINGDIHWQLDDNNWPAATFMVVIENEDGLPMRLKGFYNNKSQKTVYSVIHGGGFRMYGLCTGPGARHRNPKPDQERFVGLHKHKWSVQWQSREAYVPSDISAEWDNPVKVFDEFCIEARIKFEGDMFSPPAPNEEMFL